jgi:serine/threonine protein kinase
VHRDLKPANVLVADQGAGKPPLVKLVDFGISTLARTGDPSDGPNVASPGSQLQPLSTGEHVVIGGSGAPPPEHLTGTGIAIGTPMYMAPECGDRIRGARPPADVFSFGVIAYELLTGTLPLDRPAIVSVSRGEPISTKPVQTLCPNLRADIAAMLDLCLAASPDNRPSAAELAAILR